MIGVHYLLTYTDGAKPDAVNYFLVDPQGERIGQGINPTELAKGVTSSVTQIDEEIPGDVFRKVFRRYGDRGIAAADFERVLELREIFGIKTANKYG